MMRIIKSLWPSDALWGQRFGSILARWHRAITWTNVDLSSVRSNDIYLREISQEIHLPSMIQSAWFLPEASFGLRVLSLPASLCVCVNHLLVRAITRDLFKLGSPNLDQRCKRPRLRSLLFWGQLTLTFKVKFSLKVRIYPILSLSGPWLITHSS